MDNELEAAGEDTEGMIKSVPKLRAEIQALSGVDIMQNEHQFKSTYDILDEIAAKWEKLSDTAKAALTEDLAGKNRANILNALLSNYDTARAALETSKESEGSAMQEHEKWMDSLEARSEQLKASLQSLSQTFLDSSFLKSIVSGATEVINILDKIVDKAGTLPTILGAVFTALQVKTGKGELIKQFRHLIILYGMNTPLKSFTNSNVNEVVLYTIDY